MYSILKLIDEMIVKYTEESEKIKARFNATDGALQALQILKEEIKTQTETEVSGEGSK